jgi:hypothetical protein
MFPVRSVSSFGGTYYPIFRVEELAKQATPKCHKFNPKCKEITSQKMVIFAIITVRT